MRRDDLIRDQARSLKSKLQPMLCYLTRLRRRLAYKGFAEAEALLVDVPHSQFRCVASTQLSELRQLLEAPADFA